MEAHGWQPKYAQSQRRWLNLLAFGPSSPKKSPATCTRTVHHFWQVGKRDSSSWATGNLDTLKRKTTRSCCRVSSTSTCTPASVTRVSSRRTPSWSSWSRAVIVNSSSNANQKVIEMIGLQPLTRKLQCPKASQKTCQLPKRKSSGDSRKWQSCSLSGWQTPSTSCCSSATPQVARLLGLTPVPISVSPLNNSVEVLVNHVLFYFCADHAAMVLKFESQPDELFFLEATSNNGVSLKRWSSIR